VGGVLWGLTAADDKLLASPCLGYSSRPAVKSSSHQGATQFIDVRAE